MRNPRQSLFLSFGLGVVAIAGCGDDTGVGGGGAGATSTAQGSTASHTAASVAGSTTATGSSTHASTATGSGSASTASGSSTASGNGGAGGGANDLVVTYFGDFDTDGVHQIASLAFPSATKSTLTIAGLGGESITSLAISPDGSTAYVAGADTAGAPATLLAVDLVGGASPVVLATAPDADRAFTQIAVSPDGALVAFIADLETGLAGGNRLYAVPAAGGAAPKLLSPNPDATNQDLNAFRWARSVTATEAIIAFTGDLEVNNVGQVWTVNAAAATPTPLPLVEAADVVSGGDVGDLLDFDSDGRVYFSGDWEVDNLFRLYRSDPDGTNREQAPGTSFTVVAGESSIGSFGIDATGTQLAFSANPNVDGLYQVYVKPVDATTQTQVSNVQTTPPVDGSRGPSFIWPIDWSSDGAHLLLGADWTPGGGTDVDNSFAVFVLPTGAMGGTRIFNPPATANKVNLFSWSPDGTTIIMSGDVVTDTSDELFVTSDLTTADQDPTGARVEESPAMGDVDGFVAH